MHVFHLLMVSALFRACGIRPRSPSWQCILRARTQRGYVLAPYVQPPWQEMWDHQMLNCVNCSRLKNSRRNHRKKRTRHDIMQAASHMVSRCRPEPPE